MLGKTHRTAPRLHAQFGLSRLIIGFWTACEVRRPERRTAADTATAYRSIANSSLRGLVPKPLVAGPMRAALPDPPDGFAGITALTGPFEPALHAVSAISSLAQI